MNFETSIWLTPRLVVSSWDTFLRLQKTSGDRTRWKGKNIINCNWNWRHLSPVWSFLGAMQLEMSWMGFSSSATTFRSCSKERATLTGMRNRQQYYLLHSLSSSSCCLSVVYDQLWWSAAETLEWRTSLYNLSAGAMSCMDDNQLHKLSLPTTTRTGEKEEGRINSVYFLNWLVLGVDLIALVV